MDFLRRIVNAIAPDSSEELPIPARGCSPPFNPSPSDTVLVRSYLVHLKLPTELALTIIEYAQYYPIVRGHSNGEYIVAATYTPENSAAKLCAVSEPIPPIQDGERIRRKTVKFRIRSNDQGWGGDRGCAGTYSGSFTWFDASILRPSARGNKVHVPTTLSRPSIDCLKRYGFSLIPPHNSASEPVWRIQSNVCAFAPEKTHEVEWREGQQFDPSPGSGDGKYFLETLQPGDRIGVWARALYPGWVNYVKEINIEMLLEID